MAGLLISRQIIGNFRESALPYIMEQWRLAVICFKMWGELSPSKEHAASLSSTTLKQADEAAHKKKDDIEQKYDENEEGKVPLPLSQGTKRSIGQAEVESVFFKVFYFYFL